MGTEIPKDVSEYLKDFNIKLGFKSCEAVRAVQMMANITPGGFSDDGSQNYDREQFYFTEIIRLSYFGKFQKIKNKVNKNSIWGVRVNYVPIPH